jgi:serpin B
MVYAGTGGRTALEFESALSYPFKGREFLAAQKGLADALAKGGGGDAPEFTVANSIWPAREARILGSFLADMNDYFGPLIYPVDYLADEAGARKRINDWVAAATRDKITNFLAGKLSLDTKLILVNAVYFKGTWQDAFYKDETRDMEFNAHKAPVQAPFMHREGSFNYLELPDLQVLELFYKGNSTSMLILLPKKDGAGIAGLEKGLDQVTLSRWLEGLRSKKVEVFLPKFKITWGTLSIATPLKALGLREVFTDRADLSGISGDRSLYLSDVVHKAFVEVNEEGTEAAAATGAIMRATAMPLVEAVPVFQADHPFVFMILDKATDNIIFMGKVADPTE